MGYLEIIIGPMFSGKTSELIRNYNEKISENKKVLAINYDKDVRYGKNKIISHLPSKVSYKCVDTMAEAVTSALEKSQVGDCVLLSPACASFDMFDNYIERGEVFTKLVNSL